MEYINMDKRFKISKILIRNFIFLLLFATITIDHVKAFGFDSATSCSPNGKLSRRGRAQMLATIPCDLTRQAYCHLPGTSYPWHAVRRFVHENQGLMKRMYGDVRHISILRDEIQNNDIEMEDVEMAAERYSRDGSQRRSSKFMHNREDFGTLKSNDVLKEPHFRPVSTTTTTTTTPTPQTKKSTATEEEVDQTETNTNDNLSEGSTTTNKNLNATKDSGDIIKPQGTTTSIKSTTTTDDLLLNLNESQKILENIESDEESNENEDDGNLESNSIYETQPTSPQTDMHLGENIQIIESPQLGLNNISEASTISTTLKVVTTARTETAAVPPQHKRPQLNRQRPTQQQQQQQLHKVSSTFLKESSNIKSKLNESERIPSTSATVKGADAGVDTIITTTTKSPLKSNANTKNNHSNSPTEPTTYSSSSSSQASSLLSSSTSTSSTSASPALVLKSNIELLSGEKLRKQPSSVTTSPSPLLPTAATKPVRDGQLFQDTMKQEPAPAVNLRGVNACPVKEEVVAPFWANNTRGEVLALLNLYPFEQYVHWEKCTHEHKQMYCREGCRCEQQFRLHRLLAYDPHNECRGIFSDWFRFPSCCICKCYDIPLDFRATSRSPRSDRHHVEDRHPIEVAEEEVKKAIYEHATEEWYRPKDDFDFYEG